MLLFNKLKGGKHETNKHISIHLMLLFNLPSLPSDFANSDFNTSNVTIQLFWRLCHQSTQPYFNTSNVGIQHEHIEI